MYLTNKCVRYWDSTSRYGIGLPMRIMHAATYSGPVVPYHALVMSLPEQVWVAPTLSTEKNRNMGARKLRRWGLPFLPMPHVNSPFVLIKIKNEHIQYIYRYCPMLPLLSFFDPAKPTHLLSLSLSVSHLRFTLAWFFIGRHGFVEISHNTSSDRYILVYRSLRLHLIIPLRVLASRALRTSFSTIGSTTVSAISNLLERIIRRLQPHVWHRPVKSRQFQKEKLTERKIDIS
ncbi:hypothetical protein F4776DRAFT_400287 [Hypoxylon sp. NC0597]|nr:hypothetical protein F4776DRAFT_400287 [Hypoxylon sp. NC0597]